MDCLWAWIWTSSWTRWSALEPELLEAIDSWLGDLPVGAVAHSRELGDVLLFDWGEDGDTLRCRPIESKGLGEAREFDDLDASQPISFTSRIDFEYALPEEGAVDLDAGALGEA